MRKDILEFVERMKKEGIRPNYSLIARRYNCDYRTVKKYYEDEEKEESVPRWANISPNKEYVVFSRNFNLYWMDWENFEKARKDEKDSTIVEHRLTTTGTREFAFGSGSEDFYADSTELNKRTGLYGQQMVLGTLAPVTGSINRVPC